MALRSDRLREQRTKLGYTLEELADRLKIHSRQLSRYEHDESDPTSDVVERIARQLQVTSDYLLGLSDDPIPRLSEDDLSSDEARLLMAYRRGQTKEALQILTIGPEVGDHPAVTPRKPAANG